MPLMTRATQVVTDRLPKVVTPKTHAVLDYLMAGTCVALGVLFWKNNKRASIAAVMCGAATAANAMLTDYPGGVKKVMSFETHGKIDAGMAGLTATMPTFFAFRDEPESRYFTTLALVETIITGLTDFAPSGKVLEMPSHRTA
ncbi:MAG TPA: hypothetical protein VM056_01355 [Terriglobales bacterium]|nr:hypothetical protein [Terriglobales bacterium]